MHHEHETQSLIPNLSDLPIHILHGLIGLLVAAIVLVPVGYVIFRRYRKRQATNVDNIKAVINNEKVKSSIILRAIADGVVLVDDKGIIRLFNPAAARISGWSEQEAVGVDYRSVFKLVSSAGTAYSEAQDPFGQAFRKMTSIRDNDAVLMARSSKNVSVSLIVSPLVNSTKHVSGVVGIFRDVSEERREQQQRAEFISTASHEMRTPVAAIEGYLALALNDRVSKIDDKARGYLDKAHAATQHLGQLFQDLLTSAKAEDGRLAQHPEVTEIGSFLDSLAQDLRFAAQKKNLSVEFIMGTDGSAVNAHGTSTKVIKPLYYTLVDPDRMREVITNLFDNAVKYTDHGKITLGLTGNNEVVQIYVRDTGIGIPSVDIPHLFQKFYRVDSSATRTVGGTGLGLFICRKIIESYNGRIWVDSKEGQGSTFFINLPRLSAQQASAAKQQIQPAAAGTADTSSDTITPNISTTIKQGVS